jgi:hypothetical protein
MQSFQKRPLRDEDAEAEERELERLEGEVRLIARGLERDVIELLRDSARQLSYGERWASKQRWSACKEVAEALSETKRLLTQILDMFGRNGQPDAYQIAADAMEQISAAEEALQNTEEVIHKLEREHLRSTHSSLTVPESDQRLAFANPHLESLVPIVLAVCMLIKRVRTKRSLESGKEDEPSE